MRWIPDYKFYGLPCSYVGTACAYENITGKSFPGPFPIGLKADGYLSLDNENRYIRKLLPVIKKEYYKRGERPLLKDFLKDNKGKCCICVYGHFLYADGGDYWSFFDNENDEVVCIWYIGDK
jgi:hypothetical protein